MPAMQALENDHIAESPGGAEVAALPVLTRRDIVGTYHVAELVTLARDGSPVCWPMLPDFDRERVSFSTGYVYPTKARNAEREPRIAALFSDPTASGRSGDDPFVLVQGTAEVFDKDLQRNTERYVDELLRKGSLIGVLVRVPLLRQLMVGYLARIWIEVNPTQEYVWPRGGAIPDQLRRASRPDTFSPGVGIALPGDVFNWLPRYTRPPVLSYVDAAGWPAAIRVQATVRPDHIAIDSNLEPSEGAPACLTYHRLIGKYRANDAFIIRGHFDAAGRLVPEKVVGFGGTEDDRGLGSLKMTLLVWDLRKRLTAQLKNEGRKIPVVRPSAR
jgi:hypothetical protein